MCAFYIIGQGSRRRNTSRFSWKEQSVSNAGLHRLMMRQGRQPSRSDRFKTKTKMKKLMSWATNLVGLRNHLGGFDDKKAKKAVEKEKFGLYLCLVAVTFWGCTLYDPVPCSCGLNGSLGTSIGSSPCGCVVLVARDFGRSFRSTVKKPFRFLLQFRTSVLLSSDNGTQLLFGGIWKKCGLGCSSCGAIVSWFGP
jgi:hypothetical protein